MMTRNQVRPQKTNVRKGTRLPYNAAVQERYSKTLVALVKQMTSQCQREVTKFFKTDTAKEFYAEDSIAMDDSISAQAKILTNALMKKFNQLFADKAQELAKAMLEQTNSVSAHSLHSSLKELSDGLSIKTNFLTSDLQDIVAASVTENVGLIKSISQKYLTDMQGAVMRSITTGNGLADLVPFFSHYEGVTIRRARLIAHDQTKKALSNINAARMEKLGVEKYIWVHSNGGQHPRDLHLALDGTVQSLSNPPVIQENPLVRGKPGDLINCRCTMQPVIEFEDE